MIWIHTVEAARLIGRMLAREKGISGQDRPAVVAIGAGCLRLVANVAGRGRGDSHPYTGEPTPPHPHTTLATLITGRVPVAAELDPATRAVRSTAQRANESIAPDRGRASEVATERAPDEAGETKALPSKAAGDGAIAEQRCTALGGTLRVGEIE